MKIIKRLGRLFIYGLLLGALTLSYSYYDVLLSQLSFNLVLREPLRQSKALVVMLGGHRLDRILKGSEVYHRGFAPKVYIGSGYLKRNSTPW
ncbi:MAG: hypothetical protein KDD62_05655, partial [Bdellovibrionales bacterium]|nr:hypothetical protein [Bdellovibrionales bacterium]